jgi:ribonuclease HII
VNDSALLAHDLARGVRLIAGVDEVGRASLAGPIVAAGVLFDLKRLASDAGRELLAELNDSKRVARGKRERLAEAVFEHAEAVSLVSVSRTEIDRIGIDLANVVCLEGALRAVGERAELRLVDGRLALGAGAPVHEPIVRGDGRSATIAAASIVAKVARDRLMVGLSERYPGYGFERNKGYWSKEHVGALAKHGRTAEHRRSFNVRAVDAGGAPPAHRSKPSRAPWRELPAWEMAAHLLATPTIADRVWTDKPRLSGETRAAFIHRVVLGETDSDSVARGA